MNSKATRREHVRSSWCLMVAFTLLGGCAALDDERAGSNDDFGKDFPDAGIFDPLALEVSPLGSAQPKIGEQIKLQATVTGNRYPVARYSWKVLGPDRLALPGVPDSGAALFTFTPKEAGTHWVECMVTLETSGERISQTVVLQVRELLTPLVYTARVIPTPSSGLPPSDIIIDVGRVDQRGLNWQLAFGRAVQLTVQGAEGNLLPTMVRLIQIGGDPLPRDIYLDAGEGQVRVAGTFRALLFPQSPEFAPWLEAQRTEGNMGSAWPVTLDKGIAIKGKVLVGSSPLTGSTITLQTTDSGGVAVPSTVGLVDQQGDFMLRARGGAAQLTVVPPQDRRLPIAVVKDGLSLGHQPAAWNFTFHGEKVVKLSGQVSTNAGAHAAAGAHIVLTSQSISEVGVLSTGAGVQTAEGTYRRVLGTNALGQIVDPEHPAQEVFVPAGSYTITAWPGESEQQSEGSSRRTEELSTSPLQLALAFTKRVAVTGTVHDHKGAPALAQVRAIALSDSADAFSTVTDRAAGKFTLHLDPQARYQLIVQSRSAGSSASVQTLSMETDDKSLGTVTLPKAVVLAGKIKTEGGLTVSEALIRIWCSEGARCPTQEIVDETRVRADGSFELRVPPTKEEP